MSKRASAAAGIEAAVGEFGTLTVKENFTGFLEHVTGFWWK